MKMLDSLLFEFGVRSVRLPLHVKQQISNRRRGRIKYLLRWKYVSLKQAKSLHATIPYRSESVHVDRFTCLFNSSNSSHFLQHEEEFLPRNVQI